MAHGDLLEASDCLCALARGEKSRDATVGGLLVAEFLSLVRSALGVR